jgi:hypothetical protein
MRQATAQLPRCVWTGLSKGTPPPWPPAAPLELADPLDLSSSLPVPPLELFSSSFLRIFPANALFIEWQNQLTWQACSSLKPRKTNMACMAFHKFDFGREKLLTALIMPIAIWVQYSRPLAWWMKCTHAPVEFIEIFRTPKSRVIRSYVVSTTTANATKLINIGLILLLNSPFQLNPLKYKKVVL